MKYKNLLHIFLFPRKIVSASFDSYIYSEGKKYPYMID